MYLTDDFKSALNGEVQIDQTSSIPQEVQSLLSEFKNRVKTPAGVKSFFETCSEINTFVEDNTPTTFDIVNNDEHFMYRLGASGRHKIGFYDKNMVIVDQFAEDDYFCQFLFMLSEAISSMCLT